MCKFMWRVLGACGSKKTNIPFYYLREEIFADRSPKPQKVSILRILFFADERFFDEKKEILQMGDF